ncbi:autorepressor SdpR family transcription factor [Patescibacteria group bacterium]|nr:autorepressor SdpR family transcription factor [Patescibacteria group bacterium]
MGITDITTTLKALSDPIRRDILNLLKKKNLTAGEIALLFPISKPSLSHHFTVLKNANLIGSERKGQKIYYSLNATVFYELLNDVLETFGEKNEN